MLKRVQHDIFFLFEFFNEIDEFDDIEGFFEIAIGIAFAGHFFETGIGGHQNNRVLTGCGMTFELFAKMLSQTAGEAVVHQDKKGIVSVYLLQRFFVDSSHHLVTFLGKDKCHYIKDVGIVLNNYNLSGHFRVSMELFFTHHRKSSHSLVLQTY
jgi:hypothetical protein